MTHILWAMLVIAIIAFPIVGISIAAYTDIQHEGRKPWAVILFALLFLFGIFWPVLEYGFNGYEQQDFCETNNC